MLIGNRTAGGLANIRLATGGRDYTAAPGVVITGGGGTGAAAVAVMAGTRVDSLIITNAGTGFTGSPSIALNVGSTTANVTAVTASTASATVTFDPAVADLTWPTLVTDAGTAAIQNFFSTTQAVVSTTAVSTGAATLYHAGSGASAEAFAYTGPLRPLSFFKGRFGTVYGVDGMGRGVRWTGGTATAQPLGLHKPALGPVVTAATTSSGRRVSAIQLVDGGRGYSAAPAVSLTGGAPTKPAVVQAVVVNGRVAAVRVSDPGAGYQSVPAVQFTSGIGSGALFTVGVNGSVSGLRPTAAGTGYTSSGTLAPTVSVATSNGLTGFEATVIVDSQGRVTGGAVLNSGSGATTTPTFAVTAGTGSGATLVPDMLYAVASVSASNTGSGYFTPPVVTIRAAAADAFGGGAELDSSVDGSGHISGVTVVSGGQYAIPPQALIIDTAARAQASLAEPMRGKYLCCIRYIDGTAADVGGPLPSSISHLASVDAGTGAGTLTWAFTHPYVDDRVTAMELWRTSGDQSVLLFRVATIQKTDPEWSATYDDTLSDPELTDASRLGYGLMPITLPSGQINARRFEVPPGQFAVAAMFQDRAWYAVDTSGKAPNSLYYSEIDEPESVPLANELIVQENTDLPDKVVALVPLGSALLIAQSSHVYRLMYVAQPVLDASIMLVANRGVLNNRCWAVMAGVAFMADSVGLYAFDGNQEQSISVAVDNFWRDGIIDFSKAEKFHVSADHLTRTVRFHYCRTADSEPVRALCYCTATQAWWEEAYTAAVTATAGVMRGGQLNRALGGVDGVWRRETGTQDNAAPVAYSLRTGNMALADEPDRTIGVLYKPTASDSPLNVSLFYNNSGTARANAIQSDRGSGFTVTAGGPASLNMKKTRSALGDATGSALAHYAGRKSELSAGGDQHLAVQVAGTQSADAVTLFALRVSGVS